jgi:hypothetical protein
VCPLARLGTPQNGITSRSGGGNGAAWVTPQSAGLALNLAKAGDEGNLGCSKQISISRIESHRIDRMSLLGRHRWFAAAAGITLSYALMSLLAHNSGGLTAFADIGGLVVMMMAAGVMVANAICRPSQERSFWIPMALGFSLWACNHGAWAYCEIVQRREIPDPYFFDIILFFHVVPMIGAVAWRPDLAKKAGRIYVSALNFLMLLGWWILLYAFIVVPHQYVVLNVGLYDVYYDGLYLLENGLLLAVLALAARTSSGGWRRMDGGNRHVGSPMGSAGRGVQAGPTLENSGSASCHAGDLIPAGLWSMGGVVGPIAGRNPSFQNLYGVGGHVAAGLVHIPEAISPGPGFDEPAARISPCL